MIEKNLNEVARAIFDKVTQNTKEVTDCQKSPDALDGNWERGDTVYYRGELDRLYGLYRKEMFYQEGNILYSVCFFPIIDQIRNNLLICELNDSDIFRVSCFLWERSWKTLWRWKLICYKKFSPLKKDNDKEDLNYMCPILRTILNEHEEKERKELEAFQDKKKREEKEKDMERLSFLSEILRKIKK